MAQQLGIRFVGRGERLDDPSQGATRDGGAVGRSACNLRLQIARRRRTNKVSRGCAVDELIGRRLRIYFVRLRGLTPSPVPITPYVVFLTHNALKMYFSFTIL